MASPRGSALEAFPATHAVRRRLAQDRATAAGALRASTDVRHSGHRSPHLLRSWLLREPEHRSLRLRTLRARRPPARFACGGPGGRRTTATAVATPDTGPPLASLEAARAQVPPFRSCDRKRSPPQHASKLGNLQNHEPRGRLGAKGHGPHKPQGHEPWGGGLEPELWSPSSSLLELSPSSSCRPELCTASEQVPTTPRARTVVRVVVGISPGGTSSSAAATICK